VRDQVARYEATDGREGGTLEGRPVVILTLTGAVTGKIRKTPVMRIERDDVYVAVASAAGAPRHPAWYHNLIANPEATIEIGTEMVPVTARVASPEEREPIWTQQKKDQPGFAEYEQKTSRQIPVVILEPARS
jgi:deazaflavin-dependent oxidoreductase (nitroreductase family)